MRNTEYYYIGIVLQIIALTQLRYPYHRSVKCMYVCICVLACVYTSFRYNCIITITEPCFDPRVLYFSVIVVDIWHYCSHRGCFCHSCGITSIGSWLSAKFSYPLSGSNCIEPSVPPSPGQQLFHPTSLEGIHSVNICWFWGEPGMFQASLSRHSLFWILLK